MSGIKKKLKDIQTKELMEEIKRRHQIEKARLRNTKKVEAYCPECDGQGKYFKGRMLDSCDICGGTGTVMVVLIE